MVARRELLIGGLGVAAATTAGAFWYMNEDGVDHVVTVYNGREDPHDVTVDLEFDGQSTTYGPETIPGNGSEWTTTRFDSRGELTVRFDVDGEVVREDVHEIPTVERSRSSFAMLELLPDDEIRYGVWVED